MGARNLYVPPDERIDFRVGINLGDIIVEGDDIIGDGVNVAARLEALAEPGGICVASAIWEQVHEDLGVEFIDSGEQHVKNISKPIRVYRIALGKGARPGADAAAAGASLRCKATASVSGGGRGRCADAARFRHLVLHAARGGVAARRCDGLRSAAALTYGRSAQRTGGRRGAGGSCRLAYCRHHARARRRHARCQGRRAEFGRCLKGRSGDPQATARDANVRYLVEGEVVPAGDEIAVTVRLVDGATANQLGSERRTVVRSRLAQDQRLLLARLTNASLMMFWTAEMRRAASESAPPVTARDLVDRANWLLFSLDRAQQREARELYDEALRREPSLVAALLGRANWFDAELWIWTPFTAERDPLLAAMDRDTIRALTLDDRDPDAWLARAIALQNQWRYDAAFEALDRARSLSPTQFFARRAELLIVTGRSREALQVIDERASMFGTMDTVFRGLACDAHVHLGNYERALGECERAAAGDDGYQIWMRLTAAYAQTGDMTKAAAAKTELLRSMPTFTISRFEARQFSNNPIWVKEVREHLIPGWRKAGVPE